MIKKLSAAISAVVALSGSTVALSASPASADHTCVTAAEYRAAVYLFQNYNPGPGRIHRLYDTRGYIYDNYNSNSGYDEIRHYRKCRSFDGGGWTQVWYDNYTYSNGQLKVYSLARYA